ncbi:MAG TPA: 50S ribosomal protein L4 [bacterium]|nr:50S ribosomal protein L4 [bacterium]
MEGEKTTGSGPITFDVMDAHKNPAGKIELDPAVFDAPVKTHLLHEVVVYQEAKHRRGTACTKTRAEVAGANKKLYRQKGTGRARAGELRSPVRRGGGVVFGPKPRDFGFKVGKKVKKAALRSALSAKLKEEKLIVVDELKLTKVKTKLLLDWLAGVGAGRSALVVIPAADQTVELSARNLRKVKVLRAQGINVRDILLHDKLVLTREAAVKIQEALA